jgi:hypothetical protein
MKFIKENKGIFLFYICVSLVMAFWVVKVEKDNDRMMHEKNAYVLTNYR